MKKIWVNKCSSYKEAENCDNEYYSLMSSEERLSIIEFLRKQYWKIKKGENDNGNPKRLRGFVKIIKQA